MPRYLSPKSDLVFKKVFGQHPELLKSFLNAVLPLPDGCFIEDLTYLPPENVPEIKNLKYSIVDVRCLDNRGRHFIAEMQLQWTKHFIQRMLYNTTLAYVRQLEAKEAYRELSSVYGLALIDAVFCKDPEWFHHYRMANANDGNKHFEDIQLVFIELPKLKPTSIAQRKLAILWLRFLKEIDEETDVVDPSFLEIAPIKEALSLLEVSAYTAAELRDYDKNWDAIRTQITLIEDKLEEKYEQGLAKGKAEEKKEIVNNMHRLGLSLEQISQSVDLSYNEVKKILGHQNNGAE